MKRIVIHATMGSYNSSVNWLLSKNSEASCHYVISENGSQCTQLVRDNQIAWHTGNWEYNQSCIGIEHSWYYQDHNGTPPDALLRAGAALTAALCRKYNIVPNRGNIIRHGEIPPPNNHVDPPASFDMNKFMAYVIQAYQGGIDKVQTQNQGAAEPQNPVITFGQTDKVIGGAFRERYLELKPAISLPLIGLPLTNEFDLILNGKKRTVQIFERSIFIFQSEEAGDWRVVSANLGDAALISTYAKTNQLL